MKKEKNRTVCVCTICANNERARAHDDVAIFFFFFRFGWPDRAVRFSAEATTDSSGSSNSGRHGDALARGDDTMWNNVR